MSKLRIPRKEKKQVKKDFPYINDYEKNFIEMYYLLKKSNSDQDRFLKHFAKKSKTVKLLKVQIKIPI